MTDSPAAVWPRPWGLLSAGLGVSAVVVALAATDLLPLGVPREWEWLPRIRDLQFGPFTAAAVLLCLVTVGLTGRALNAARAPRRLVCGVLVLLCLLSSGSLLLGPLADDPVAVATLGATTTSIGAMGYYGLAVRFDSLSDGFRMYVTRDTSLGMPGRIQTHPPGPFLWAHWGRRLTQACPALSQAAMGLLNWRYGFTAENLHSFAFGYAMPGSITVAEAPGAWLNGVATTLIGGLLPLSAYLLAAGLWDRRAGLGAAVIATSIPSLLAFVPSIDGMAAVLGMAPVVCLAWAARRDSLGLASAAGLALAVALLWTTGLVAVLGPMAGLCLFGSGSPAASRRRLGLLGAAVLTTFAAHVVLFLATGYSLPRDFQVMSAVHHGQVGGRSYWLWLPMNLWDFILFMGPALVLVVTASTVRARLLPARVAGAVLGMVGALLLILISGVTRGEVGRIWLFMMPLLTPGVAGWLARLPGPQSGPALLLLTASQLLVGLGLYRVLELVHP